jgi:hypothetical protein
MSALSASTYSCGGESGRLGGGGEEFSLGFGVLVGSGLGAELKKRWSPVLAGLFIFASMASSSLEGADESDELSESAIAFAGSRFTVVVVGGKKAWRGLSVT